MIEFAEGLQQINRKWNLQIATCAEKIDLEKYGISHNKCIDDKLIIKLFNKDQSLMQLLDYNGNESQNELFADKPNQYYDSSKLKDKGQREFCGCILSKDIGQYNTCPHLCVYCYANASKETALTNFHKHKTAPFSETIIGD